MPVLFEYVRQNPLTFYARFDSSAICEGKDINKLFGFSDCNSQHHENSVRIGWRWTGKLELFSYSYANGIREIIKITDVPLNTWVVCSIEVSDRYTVCASGQCVEAVRGNVCDTGVYYKLWPYYGGNEVAPHDVIISIKSF